MIHSFSSPWSLKYFSPQSLDFTYIYIYFLTDFIQGQALKIMCILVDSQMYILNSNIPLELHIPMSNYMLNVNTWIFYWLLKLTISKLKS